MNHLKMRKYEIKIIVANELPLQKQKKIKCFYFTWLKVTELKQREIIYFNSEFLQIGQSS